jgi:hypothetical protein
MEKPSSLLLLLILMVAGSNVLAQKDAGLPPKLNSDSSLADILNWLNQNAFPYARVGLRKQGGSAPRGSFGLPRQSVPGGERIFSEGFQIKWINGCHVTLSNEHATIIDARNPSSGSFHRFISQNNKNRELTPQLALLYLPLNRMSDTRGKGPYLQTNDQQKAKLLGPWRTSFDQKGFFRRSIFELELTAAEQPQTKELGSFGYLTFNFDSKDLAEQFNAAFRSAIRICNAK